MDIYNATSNSWTSHPAGLGQARSLLAAASLPTGLIFFAGGSAGSHPFVLLQRLLLASRSVPTPIVFVMRNAHNAGVGVLMGSSFVDTIESGSSASSYVDMFNVTNNSWTRFPEGLGQNRYELAAASLPSGLVFFAGGLSQNSAQMTSGLAKRMPKLFCRLVSPLLPHLVFHFSVFGDVRFSLTQVQDHRLALCHRMLTFTMQQTIAGPGFLQDLDRLAQDWRPRLCIRAWFSSQEA